MKNKHLFIALFLFVFLSIVLRIPYYVSYHIPGVTGDSFTYSKALKEMLNGQSPKFDSGTPGYPIFVAACYFAGLQSLYSLFIIQYICSILVYGLIIYLVFKSIKTKWIFWTIIAIFTLYFNSPIALSQETTLSPIALFANFFALSLTLCIRLWFSKNCKTWEYFLLSFCLGFLISLRPQIIALSLPFGIFLIKLLYDKNYTLALAVIVIPVLTFLSICSYKYFSVGRFLYTDQMFQQKLISSVLYLQKSDKQPVYINNAIDSVNEKLQGQFPGQDLNQVITENKADMDFYTEYFESTILRTTSDKKFSIKQENEIIEACNNRNKYLYYQKVLYTTKECLLLFSMKKEFYLTEIKNRIYYIAERKKYNHPDIRLRRLVTREYFDFFYGKSDIRTTPLDVKKIYKPIFIISTLYSRIFLPILFLPLYFISLVFFSYLSIREILRGVFPFNNLFWCAILLTPVANAIIIGLYVIPYPHYNYPSDIIVLFSFPLFLYKLYVAQIVKRYSL